MSLHGAAWCHDIDCVQNLTDQSMIYGTYMYIHWIISAGTSHTLISSK